MNERIGINLFCAANTAINIYVAFMLDWCSVIVELFSIYCQSEIVLGYFA